MIIKKGGVFSFSFSFFLHIKGLYLLHRSQYIVLYFIPE